jgi:hypothetical protein
MLTIVPEKERPENPAEFYQAVAEECLQLIDYASRAQQPQIIFGDGGRAGSQYIWEFFVNDLAQPVRDTINWHGQNTSQWLYAGAIVLQNREVSRHH